MVVLCNTGGVEIDEIWKYFQSKDAEEKKGTQLISITAKKMGFDGILYPSVRAPVDMTMPNMNLVMFNSSKIQLGMPPKDRLN